MSADTVAEIEAAAKNSNLTVEAYLRYLMIRAASADAARLDRHVREVFGKHGELMRRLAK